MKRMPKNITIEELAVITKDSIDGLEKSIHHLATEMKQGFDSLGKEMRSGFTQVNRRLDELEENSRLHRADLDICRKHRALTDARLGHMEKTLGLQN